MINRKAILAIIPARSGSKGLPHKNVVDLCGKPLLGWPIQAAMKSKYVDKVIVSTDDEDIAKTARAEGAEVPFIRPAELASDTATSISVIEHAISFHKSHGQNYDYIILLEPTSPLTDSEDIDKAMELLDSSRTIADAIVGVSKLEQSHPLFTVVIDDQGLIKPFYKQDYATPIRRQDLSTHYFFDGSLYISDKSVLLERKSFYHDRTLPYIVPKWKAFEVDDLVDLICIKAIMHNLHVIKVSDK
jgi:CMP-N,N'-diacetyllegionaminic acid synthase